MRKITEETSTGARKDIADERRLLDRVLNLNKAGLLSSLSVSEKGK